MFFQPVIQQAAQRRDPVRVALIGSGMFGSGIVTHARYVPSLRVCAIADTNLDAARQSYHHAGVADDQIVVCDSSSQVRAALEAQRYVIAPNADAFFDQPLDVIVEATGIPEFSARHAHAAIAHGKHVAMVSKEADAAVGPMLKYLADRAGVVYTAVDGDQHGLLIALVYWARTLGMEVLCGGKALDGELILEAAPPAIVRYGDRRLLPPEAAEAFAPITTGDKAATIAHRGQWLGEVDGAKPWDLVELTIAANATGLSPDIPQTHCPASWTTEIPTLLCPKDLGGLLQDTGRIDAVQIIRRPHEASMGGGVFIVVRTSGHAMKQLCDPAYSVCHPDKQTSLLWRPHHLLGIEAIGSILAAALTKTPTAALDYRPRFDVVYQAKRDLKAGQYLGADHSSDLEARIIPAVPLTPASPLPSALAQHNQLLRDVPKGQFITLADVQRPVNSALWSLREQQQSQFAIR